MSRQVVWNKLKRSDSFSFKILDQLHFRSNYVFKIKDGFRTVVYSNFVCFLKVSCICVCWNASCVEVSQNGQCRCVVSGEWTWIDLIAGLLSSFTVLLTNFFKKFMIDLIFISCFGMFSSRSNLKSNLHSTVQ